MPTSTTVTRARARANRHGWPAQMVRTELDARAVLDAGCYFDIAGGERVVRFFTRLLKTSDGEFAGKPFKLMPWQEHEVLRPLFGWKRGDGTRRYRRGGIWIPKKNGKSTMAGGLILYLQVGDNEPAAEVYTAANDRGQAGIIYGQAVKMVEASPELMKRFGERGIIRSRKTLYDARTASVFQALSADAPTKEGLNIHGLVVDEIHAMLRRTLWDTLIYGGAARRQPLMLSISTAGVYEVGSIGWEQYDYAKQIESGTNEADWSFFSLIYEAPKDADWTAVETHKAANPSYGITVKPDALAEECREAQQQPAKENAFRRYRLNQWVQQASRWIPLDLWDANNVHPVSLRSFLGATVWAGLDLASTRDITAYVKFRQCPHDPDAIDILPRFWVPEAALTDPHNRNAALYRQWKRDGFLETTPGNTTDYRFITKAVTQDHLQMRLVAVGLDRAYQGASVQNDLTDEGIEVPPIGASAAAQGPAMNELEKLWTAKRCHHGGHPVLRWMAENVEIKEDESGNKKIIKPNGKDDPRKVDGMQALNNAVDVWFRQESEPVAAPPELIVV